MSGRFRRYSDYLSRKYGTTAYRVAVDAGFTCPNRGRDRTTGGCAYCDELGSRAAYSRGMGVSPTGRMPCDRPPGSETPGASHPVDVPSAEIRSSIARQISSGVSFLRSRYGAEVFLLYFQAFSGTYGEPEYLRAVYDFGLSRGDFRELIVATRPDCVDESVARLLASYRRPGFDVWVELGLQSACDETLARIRRGHTVGDFSRAFGLLRSRGIKICCHLIFGLPGESTRTMMESVDFVARLRPDAVKFHDLHIPTGSLLYRRYREGELSVACGDRHITYLTAALQRLPADTVIMRLTCDTPSERRAAPRAAVPKSAVYSRVDRELERRGSEQGSLFRGYDSATASAMS